MFLQLEQFYRFLYYVLWPRFVNNYSKYWSWQHVRGSFSKYCCRYHFWEVCSALWLSSLSVLPNLWKLTAALHLTLRWRRYSWGSPITLYPAMEVSGFRPKCAQSRFFSTICSLVGGCSCNSTCGDFTAWGAGRVQWVLLWVMTNYLSQFLSCFYNYSPFPPILK